MSPNVVTAETPYYVLMEDNRRIGPKVVPPSLDGMCVPIYAFSGKGPYDKFCQNTEQQLRPFPLVKAYLRNQAETAGEGLKLVVIDATGPCEPCVHAATMEAVLAAHENRTAQVTAAHSLVFDQNANAYRVQADAT